VTARFSCLVAWNHDLFALGLATGPDVFTRRVATASTIGEIQVAGNDLMAGATIAPVPILVLHGGGRAAVRGGKG
jgi:ABC-type glycerol-3-phosphate transport system permease component